MLGSAKPWPLATGKSKNSRSFWEHVLEVEPGRHLWILARTDRDAPSPSEVLDTAANFMARALFQPPLSRNSTAGLISLALPSGGRRYSVGAARPLDIHELVDRPPPIPPRTASSHVEDQPEVLKVKATRPKFVAVDFDWHGPTQELPDWPRRKVDIFGDPVDDPLALDWLLLDEYFLGEASRDEITPGDIVADHVRRVLPTLPQTFSVAALLLLGWWLVSSNSNR